MNIDMDVDRLSWLTVLTSEYLVETAVPEVEREVRRTWPERLFSRPWRPLRGVKTVVVTELVSVPSREVITLPGNKVLVHPSMRAELLRKFEAESAAAKGTR